MNRSFLLSVIVGVSNTSNPTFGGLTRDADAAIQRRDAFRHDLDDLDGAAAAAGQRFRFRDYSQERLWTARWLLFEFPEVRNVVHLADGIVAVLHEGEPRVREWIALLDACGFALEPVEEATSFTGRC
jgi:hypothetical protein